MTTGRRFGGLDALAAAIVDGTANEAGLVAAAVERVLPLAVKDTETLGAIKAEMFAGVVDALLGRGNL